MRLAAGTGCSLLIWLWAVCGATQVAHAARFVVAGSADTVMVTPGQSFTLEFVVREAGPAFNAFDLDVRFDPARLTNQPLSPLSSQRGTLMTGACLTNSPFHSFVPSPDSLMCTLVILCAGVSVTGPGQLYRTGFVAAMVDAWTEVTLGTATQFYLGGPRVDTLEVRPIVIRIGNPPTLDAGRAPVTGRMMLDPLSPNPRREATALRFSFALPRADAVGWELLDAQGRRVAHVAPQEFGAGRHSASLDVPRVPPGRYSLSLRSRSGERSVRPWIVLR